MSAAAPGHAPDHLALLARVNGWANQRVYASVARLPDAAYRAERGAFFGSIHRTLNHLLVVDRLWTGRLLGSDRGIRATSRRCAARARTSIAS